MALFLQNPFDPNPDYLIETLLDACQNATSGGGAFAFATATGAKLLLEDETFVKFATTNAFDLVVGVDAITNTSALQAIGKATKSAPKLKASVFLNPRREALFHPKFCWFRLNGVGRLIVGSGNLTFGGLRGNWEAFSVSILSKSEIDEVEALWLKWKLEHKKGLFPHDDPKVIARASENTGWVQLIKTEKPGKPDNEPEDEDEEEEETGPIANNSAVLIAEIPRSGNRWNQANFDVDNYENYFGAKVGTQRRIVLQHVNADGTLGELESRPSVAVQSQNYRFELAAASGHKYPQTPPIGVFVKVAPRTFRYRLLMPNDPDYALIASGLAKMWSGNEREMQRVRTSVPILRKLWAQSPFWKTK